MWARVNCILNRNTSHSAQVVFVINDAETNDGSLRSKNMNHCFANVGGSLAGIIANEDDANEFLNNFGGRSDNTLRFETINVSDLKVVFSSIRNTSPGYDEISIQV